MELREYNAVNKMELIKSHKQLQNKFASVCIAIGISGDEAKQMTAEELKAHAQYLINRKERK